MSEIKHSVHFNDVHPDAAYIKKLDTHVQTYVRQVRNEYPHHHLILRAMNDENIKDYIKAGFIEFRRTYEQDIKVIDLINYLSPYKKALMNFNFNYDAALISQSYKIYKETHMANPVKDMPLDEWDTLISPDLDYEHSIVLYDEPGKIKAFLIMYDANTYSKDIGYVYFSDAAAKEQLYSALYIKLNQLKKIWITEVSVEVDNTDRYAYEFFESLIIHDASYMRTLILSRKTESI